MHQLKNEKISICIGKLKSDGPVFRLRPKSVEADNGASITLTCDVVGNPMPDILWIHEPNDKVNNSIMPPKTQESNNEFFKFI